MPNIERIFERYSNLVGTLGGDLFNVYRPDYTKVDNTPRLVAQNIKFRCDPTSAKFAEPKFGGVSYYDIFGPRSIIRTGDILKIAAEDMMTPPITIATFFPVKAMIGFRSAQRGYIEYAPDSGQTGVLYTNIYFDFLNESFPGSPLNKQLAESLKMPTTKAVLYNRPNLVLLGTHLVQQFPGVTTRTPEGTSVPYERRWIVEAIDQSGPEMILTVRTAG